MPALSAVRLPIILGALLAIAGPARTAVGAPPDTPAPSLTVGHLTLHRCESAAPWCGFLARPLDPRGAIGGTIPIYFEYYPHRAAGPAAGTLVATQGGPGYPATESRDEYLALFDPLRSRYDVLIMDNRGTGRSGALDCSELQNAAQLTEANIGSCGQSLGGAASLYSTALAGDDLAAILDALAIGRVGLYGDSYGTYFAQVFALRHPQKLRSLVLDGAYPLDGTDYPWYPNYAPAMRTKFDLACARAPACKALGGSSMQHIAPALALLRSGPFAARVGYGDERTAEFTADASTLAIVMFGSAPAYASVRETDAAARAFSDGDRAPLLRLMAETLAAVDSRDATRSPAKFSAGLAAAVSCQDPPQIFDMRLPVVERLAAREESLTRRRAAAPDTYAPFTIDEYRRMPLDYAYIDQCVQWPARPDATPLVFEPARYPDVPVLVVSGELDNMTSAADGADAAARFPRARHIVITNGFHVNALPHSRSECGAILVRRFMDELTPGDTSCAAEVPPVRLVPRFARTAHELTAALGSAENRAGAEQLRVVSAALLTCADVIARAVDDGAGRGTGLRGGTFAVEKAAPGYRLTLNEVRWTDDVGVSGRIEWPGRTGEVHADLTVQSPAGAGTLAATWPEGVGDARAAVRGQLGERRVVAEAPAP